MRRWFPGTVVVLLVLAATALPTAGAEGPTNVPGSIVGLRTLPGDSKIELAWGPTDGWTTGDYETGYNVYRGLDLFNMSYVGTCSYPGYTDAGLANGVMYYYEVGAYNSLGEGGYSVTSGRPGFPPVNVTASPWDLGDCGPADITITWSHPVQNHSAVLFYRVYAWGTFGVDRNSTSFTQHINYGCGYDVRVSAVDASGNEFFSDPAHVIAPMCEGGGCDICSFVLIAVIASVLLVAGVIVFFVQRRNDK